MEPNPVEMLRNSGIKVTPQRLSLLEMLYRGGHYTGEQLYNMLKEKIPGISISTVYNTLETLESLGIISSFEANGMKWYESKTKVHVNMYCVDEDRVVDLDLDVSEISKKLKDSGIDYMKMNIIIYSNCKDIGKKRMSIK